MIKKKVSNRVLNKNLRTKVEKQTYDYVRAKFMDQVRYMVFDHVDDQIHGMVWIHFRGMVYLEIENEKEDLSSSFR